MNWLEHILSELADGIYPATFPSITLKTKVSEFSTDTTLAGDSNEAIPTEHAVKSYVDNVVANTGDVTGPGSASDNALVRFDGTTGKLLQNSSALLDDSGNLSLTGDLIVDGGNIGVTGKTDLLSLSSSALSVSGSVSATAGITGTTVVGSIYIMGQTAAAVACYLRNTTNPGVVGLNTSVVYSMRNAAGTLKNTWVELIGQIATATAGIEDGRFSIKLLSGGSSAERLVLDAAGGLHVDGFLDSGVSGTTRGGIATWRGSGTDKPGVWIAEARSGADYYLWMTDGGQLRYHTSLPTSDTDGSPVGGSSSVGDDAWGLVDTVHASYLTEGGPFTGLAPSQWVALQVAVADTRALFVVEFLAKLYDNGGAGNEGYIDVYLTSGAGNAYSDAGVQYVAGEFYRSSSAAGPVTMTGSHRVTMTEGDNVYRRYRVVIAATRLTPGSYYINVFGSSYALGGGNDPSLYLDDLTVYTNS